MYRVPGSGVKSDAPLSGGWGVSAAMLTVFPINLFEAITAPSPSTRSKLASECVPPFQVKTASLAVKLVRHSPTWFSVTTSEGTHPSSPRTTTFSICNLRSTSIMRWFKATICSASEVLLCSIPPTRLSRLPKWTAICWLPASPVEDCPLNISTLAMRPSSALNRPVSGELPCSTPATRFSRLSRRAAICRLFVSTVAIVPELVSIAD